MSQTAEKVLGWHLRVGSLGLRLFQIHLLWLAHVLLGGVVAGLMPATAAAHAVIRSELRGAPQSPGLLRQFHRTWRQNFWSANLLGLLLGSGWGLLLFDRLLVARHEFGPIGWVVSGLLVQLSVLAFVITVVAFPLAAHFDEGPLATIRRSCILVLGKPFVAGRSAAIVAIAACLYYVVPGTLPVFGIALPAYLSFSSLWRSGVMPLSAQPHDPHQHRIPKPSHPSHHNAVAPESP